MKNDLNQIHTAWIPNKFARINKKIRIDSMPGIWTITNTHETKSYEYVNSKSQEYKHAFASIEEH
jgi:hypothetical protein